MTGVAHSAGEGIMLNRLHESRIDRGVRIVTFAAVDSASGQIEMPGHKIRIVTIVTIKALPGDILSQ